MEQTIEDYRLDNIVKARHSSNKYGVSGHGSDLVRFHKSTQFRIMNGRWEKGVDEGKFTCISPKESSVADCCLIREGSLALVKEFRIGNLTCYSDHTILNIELQSDKPFEDELHEVQPENAKQKLESRDGKALTIDNSDLNEICESYNCRFVPS